LLFIYLLIFIDVYSLFLIKNTEKKSILRNYGLM